MENKNGLEVLIGKIPRNGMSKDCQKFLPFIVGQYFSRKHPEQLKNELKNKNKGFVDVIYNELDQIKIKSLRKISGIMAKYPEDLRDDPVFADTVITYCIKFSNLEKEIFKVFRKLDKKNKNVLYNKYKKGESSKNDYLALRDFAKNSNFYVFIMDEILNGKC